LLDKLSSTNFASNGLNPIIMCSMFQQYRFVETIFPHLIVDFMNLENRSNSYTQLYFITNAFKSHQFLWINLYFNFQIWCIISILLCRPFFIIYNQLNIRLIMSIATMLDRDHAWYIYRVPSDPCNARAGV
jgi:hypothetical protein